MKSPQRTAYRSTRRTFLKTTSAAVVGVGVWSSVSRAASKSPNEKLNIGIVGVNHRGKANTNGVASDENIVALCDIDDHYLAEAAQRFPKATRFNDWRKLMDEPSIDAVMVSTADHNHTPAALAAMRHGKHVYCEKPLAHTVEEARLMRNTYKASNVATQMGTQIHATDNYRRVVELVRAGAVGAVRKAHVWCGRTSGKVGVLPGGQEVPAHLKWDLWLGPAQERPYNSGYLPGNLTWNRWWDFGNGVLGDMGSHLIDLPYWALGLKHPTRVAAEGPPVDPYCNPPWMIVTWDHPATSARPELQLIWYHHDRRPKSPPGIDLTKWHIGVMFEGDDGYLVADYRRRVLLPEDKFKDYQPPEPTIAPSLGHYKEWTHAAKTGGETLCNFEYSGALIEHNLLGNVAYRCGGPLEWNAETLTAKGEGDPESYIKKEYRRGWDPHV